MPDITRPWTSTDDSRAQQEFGVFEHTKPFDSKGSFNETILKGLPPIRLKAGEAEFAAQFPNAYGVLGATLEMFPYTRYALGSNREQFEQLDKEDQINALLVETLGATLWMFGGRIIKDAGYVAKQTARPFKWLFNTAEKAAKVPKILPVEDAVKDIERMIGKEKAAPFSYGDVVRSKLQGKGFGKDESEALHQVLAGEDEGRLLDVVLNRRYLGKDPTKPFEEAVKWETGRLYPRPTLREAFKKQYAEPLVRADYYNKQFTKVLIEDVYKKAPAEATVKHIFNAHAERLFGKNAPAGFGEVTPHHMANILYDMLENRAVTWMIASPGKMPSFHPARVVFGAGERWMKTKTMIYEPIKRSLSKANRNYFNHALLFAKMLEQRGAYTRVTIKETGEFAVKKAKWLTPQVQDEAYKVLRQFDDLTRQAERLTSKAEIAEIQNQLSMVGKDMSPGARVLVDAWRTYSDHLYGEHMKMQIPRVFRKVGLTNLGQAKIDELMGGAQGLGYEIDRLFSTISSRNPVEKTTGAKEILKKAKARLEFFGDEHPYFTPKGKDLEKALAKAEKALTWGGGRGNFVKYLENYVARVAQHEDALLMKWREGLFKNQQAFYTKPRKLEKMRGEPVDFGTMIQARTMAHAKEQFLYDTLGEVVDYTMGLPPSWIRYIEDYIGGILNVSTVSDYLLAQFFTATVGAGERQMSRIGRLFGKEWGGEGLWSERRILNLAYTVNNLTYLGGLGFKPFSAVRNLFQPLLTVAADLGGLKDLGHLVSGYKWALNPKNRAYIRSLGAIAEYAPEVHLRPSMIVKGKTVFGKELPTIEQVRDAGMWMFKGADRFNRYVSGGAAHLKWEKTVEKMGLPKTANEVKFFSRKMGITSRRDWVRAEIEDLLHRGKFADAKAVWINDVIADTQYLYGAAEAPTILRKFGGVGRTAAIFQSWWMNYGSLLSKWATTGNAPAKVQRMFTAMISQTMAYMLMEPLWGKGTAKRSTFLGAFPKEFNEFLLPPAFAPIYHAGAAMMNIQSPEVTSRHAKAALDSLWIFAPAGLQLKTFYKATKKEGWEGFGKAFLNLPVKEGKK